jgi:hypothetical protein
LFADTQVDTFKRTSIKALPPSISFVFKRFALDYNTMQTVSQVSIVEFQSSSTVGFASLRVLRVRIPGPRLPGRIAHGFLRFG